LTGSPISAVPVVTALLIVAVVATMSLPDCRPGIDGAIRICLSSDMEHQMLAISKDASFWLNAKPTTAQELHGRLSDLLKDSRGPVLIQADREASFAIVMAEMDAMRERGIREIGLVTSSWRPDHENHSRIIAYRVFPARNPGRFGFTAEIR